ncbi:MAG: hypothetical protein HRF49_03625 [bacterium]|jgi:hypothetical protein
MGSVNLFECKSCGYGCEVGGGKDRGFLAVTQTFKCEECLELFDGCVGTILVDGENPQLKKRRPRCPNSAKHRITPWNHPSPCPKCGGDMERNEEYLVMWD